MALDIGAHIGFYTVILSKLVGDNGQVISFEPDSSNYKLLCDNIVSNDLNNVTIHPLAVSDRNQESVPIYRCIDNSGDSRCWIKQSCSKCIKGFGSQTTLDRIISGKVDFIKIDAGGYEPKILLGMIGILKSQKMLTIALRYSPEDIGLAGSLPSTLFDILSDFSIYKIELAGLHPLQPEQVLLDTLGYNKGPMDLVFFKGHSPPKWQIWKPKLFQTVVGF